jgi:hypothetical protein
VLQAPAPPPAMAQTSGPRLCWAHLLVACCRWYPATAGPPAALACALPHLVLLLEADRRQRLLRRRPAVAPAAAPAQSAARQQLLERCRQGIPSLARWQGCRRRGAPTGRRTASWAADRAGAPAAVGPAEASNLLSRLHFAVRNHRCSKQGAEEHSHGAVKSLLSWCHRYTRVPLVLSTCVNCGCCSCGGSGGGCGCCCCCCGCCGCAGADSGCCATGWSAVSGSHLGT